MGAIDPGSWQDWHFAWNIGAMSLVNTGDAVVLSSARDGR
jgi:hypothetical protein